MSSQAHFATCPGWGPCHFILVPGLVPDGPETFLRQQHLFLTAGSTTTITYPYDDFDLDTLLSALESRVVAAHANGEAPVLVGVSIGGGICLELLRRCRARGHTLPISAIILVSPFTCTNDLAPLLKRLIEPILATDEQDAFAALDRGRGFFRLLASRSITPQEEAAGWRKLLALLTPSGQRARQERLILSRIERTLESIPAAGAMKRVTSLRQILGIASDGRSEPLTRVPALILWGSKERQTLSMDGPGTSILCRPDRARAVFPNAEVHWVYDDGEDVPHASLLKHAHAFNPHLKPFVKRIRALAAAPKAEAV